MKRSTLDGLNFLVETSVARDEWDEMPMILFTREGEEPDALVLLQGEGNPAEALPSIAEQIKSGEFPVPLDGVTGVVLFVEGWKLKGEPGKQEELRAEVEALREMGRRYEDHPDATEMKGWYAIDSEGQTSRSFERGAAEVVALPDDVVPAGRIPDGLKMIFEAVSA